MITNTYGYAHLNCIKGQGGNVTISSATLTEPSLRSLFHEWDGTGANANITVQKPADFVWRAGEEVAAYDVIYGTSNGWVPEKQYADLTQYDNMVVTFDNTKATPRFLFNKANGETLVVESEGDYMTIDGNQITIHLAKLASDNGRIAHLNCIKASNSGSSTIYSVQLEKVEKPVTITKTIAVGSDLTIKLDGNLLCDHIPYNYIRLELVDGDNVNRVLYRAADGQNMSENVTNATFRVESWAGDKQNTYKNENDRIYSNASYGQWYDGVLVSSGTFTFKLPNRNDYASNHLRIYLARYDDYEHGVDNPPVIEKTYDYMLWMAGDESNPNMQVHQEYVEIDVDHPASDFTVNLNGDHICSLYNKESLNQFSQFYLRWYVADKVTHQPITDENGNPISLNPVLSNVGNYTPGVFHREDVGMVWYLNPNYMGGANVGTLMANPDNGILGVHVNLPNGLTQNDVELVALTTTNFNNSGVNIEPNSLEAKIVVNFVKQGEIAYMNQPFRHYKGVTGRDWVKPENSTGEMKQSIWKASTSYNKLLPTVEEVGDNHNSPLDGAAKDTVADIRQGVHTWEYNVYITPGDGRRALVLPFENYMYNYQTGISADGNDLEPRAYFRWYDWKTDMAVVDNKSSFSFEACNSDILKPYMETVDNQTRDRGLVALNIDPNHPTQGRVGVWLTVNDNFNLQNYPNGIDIACDVSKYSDGINIIGTSAYLEHEPTLSMRYIFHVYPAKVIADTLSAAKANLSKCRVKLEDEHLSHDERLELFTQLVYYGKHDDDPDKNINPMFDLPENVGRVVVSLGENKIGNFSLRLDEHLLENYKMYDNGGNIVTADHVKWVAFYEDEKDGHVMRKELKESTSRIQTFTYSDFVSVAENPSTYYYHLGSPTADEIVTDGMRFHVIGYVTKGENVNTINPTSSDVFAPVVHYELQFLVAPPLSVAQLKNNAELRAKNITRTDEYMTQHYDLQSVVDFDGNRETNKNIDAEPERKKYFYSFLNKEGESIVFNANKDWYENPDDGHNNMSWLPRKWTDIEYSYCYPQLVNYVIDTYSGYWQYNNYLSPFHGDYMILKSMNKAGVSPTTKYAENPGPFNLQWWWSTELYDYTHVYTDNSKYGSFLYTDASNESRTMVTIPFEADLCAGSSIYVTMAVADMTNAQIKPQLLIRVVGVDDDGNHKNVVSFHTCDINTTGAETGEWYQVYGESSVPINFDDDVTHFICEVVNYADNTNGADFAIDQFQVYTTTAKIKLTQDQGKCDDPETNKMFIYAEAEAIQALYGRSGEAKIYWRIHDEHGEPVTAVKMYSDSDDGTSIYGLTQIDHLDYTNYMYYNNNIVNSATVKANDNLYWFMGDDGKVYCKIAYRYLPGLLDGQTYYVSIYSPSIEKDPEIGFRPEATSYWGGLHTAATSKCSVFSPDFIPRQQFVIYYKDVAGIAEGGHIFMDCGGVPQVQDMQMRLKKPDVTQPSGFTNVDNLNFDFFFGTMTQWVSSAKFDDNYTFAQLRSAVEDYRYAYPNEVGVNSSYNKEVDGVQYKDVLNAAIAAKILKLSCSQTFSNDFSQYPSPNYTVLALSVQKNIGETAICSPFMVKFDIQWPSPEMELGFQDVEYPQREGLHRVVRIGLEQLYNLRTQSYRLHIPIHDYKNKEKSVNTGTLYFQEDSQNNTWLTVSAVSKEQSDVADTNDPIGPAVGAKFAKIITPNSSSSHGSKPFVDADYMFLVLDLSDCEINFHEGYTYEVSTSFYDMNYNTGDHATTSPCPEDIYLTIKVVPEYVTWDPQQLNVQTTGGVDYYNVNWNNDENWNRSERAEMYMDATNTPSAWRVAATTENLDKTPYYGNYYYKNDTEINASLNSSNAFVPMKFTYVTLPEGCHAPSLINMDLRAYNTSPYTGGAIQAGNLVTDPSPYDPNRTVNSPATPDIRYDLLVRYSENTCQGHLKSDKTTVYQIGTFVDGDHQYGKVYDCEKYYGNVCKEIYFKPRAELINQQRLVYYEKAWVEKELEPNKWYLMSAPLKATYAGDMYVPKTDGRQTTEAFQPITFNTTSYSRTTYPFYQHSWDHGTGGSTVYVQSSDPIHSDYTADLPYTGTVTQTFAQWSHAFNDVQVRYDQMQGFAIHTKQDKTKTGNALLRLPKADTSWDYYNYKDVQGTLNQGGTKGELNYGRFLTDDEEGKPINNRAEMTKALVQPNTNTNNKYYLVGNPYMASLDMSKFFEANTHLEPEWWAINGDPAAGEATGRVRPMEAFFVKIKEGSSSATPVNFNKDMMVDGNDGTVQSGSRRPRLQLKATKDGVTSTAIVELNDSATNDFVDSEDVETLFDSNLADVPMVYTVASDGMALSINQLPEIVTVPFGVTCSSDEQVEVTVDLSPLTTNHSPFTLHPSPIFVFDAQTGITRAISDGETISIQPNDYGRYYLTTNEKIGNKEQNADDDIVISVRQGGVVTVSAQGQLSLVRAVSVSGATAYEKTDCGTTTEFRLQQGTYVIETAGDAGRRTIKILVR